jgi:hypothetical protein
LGGRDTLWNGSIVFRPGAPNVVPNEAEMVLEFRDTDPAILDKLEREVRNWVQESNRGACPTEMEMMALIAPTPLAQKLADALASSARKKGEEPVYMPSGAGHDAMVMGRYMPAAMLFVPSIGGRSHDITEDTAQTDIVFAAVPADAVERIRAQPDLHGQTRADVSNLPHLFARCDRRTRCYPAEPAKPLDWLADAKRAGADQSKACCWSTPASRDRARLIDDGETPYRLRAADGVDAIQHKSAPFDGADPANLRTAGRLDLRLGNRLTSKPTAARTRASGTGLGVGAREPPGLMPVNASMRGNCGIRPLGRFVCSA